ncbi:hypothetical protein FGO68_gene4040 [Halteria grandinella]|uniref:Uncharacterized protein n=1 Tax=Halteria grandinella TaxID=5974 RepID=A0A8J8NUN5_HALGN|nr:hypothetical protein FGO68_gene4040 [Halteria grandinella]
MNYYIKQQFFDQMTSKVHPEQIQDGPSSNRADEQSILADLENSMAHLQEKQTLDPNSLQMDYVFELFYKDVVPLISNINPDQLHQRENRKYLRPMEMNASSEICPLNGIVVKLFEEQKSKEKSLRFMRAQNEYGIQVKSENVFEAIDILKLKNRNFSQTIDCALILYDITQEIESLFSDEVKEAIDLAKQAAKVSLLIGLKSHGDQRRIDLDEGVLFAFQNGIIGYFECEAEIIPTTLIQQFIQGMELVRPSLLSLPPIFEGHCLIEQLRQTGYYQYFGYPFAEARQIRNKINDPHCKAELVIEGSDSVVFFPYQVQGDISKASKENILIRSKYWQQPSEKIGDLLGQQEFRKVIFNDDMCSTSALIFLFDISSRESFENAKEQLQDVQELYQRHGLTPRMTSARDIFLNIEQDKNLLQGEKTNFKVFQDLFYLVGVEKFPQIIPLFQRQVSFEEASNCALFCGNAKYLEISQISQHNIESLFSLISQDLRSNDQVHRLGIRRRKFCFGSLKLLCKQYWQNFNWLKLLILSVLQYYRSFLFSSDLSPKYSYEYCNKLHDRLIIGSVILQIILGKSKDRQHDIQDHIHYTVNHIHWISCPRIFGKAPPGV